MRLLWVFVFLVACTQAPVKKPVVKVRPVAPPLDSSGRFSPFTDSAMRSYWDWLHKVSAYSGVTLVVQRDSFFVWYAGMADSALAVNPDLPMQIASVSKPFCAASIMLLRQQGRIRLTDTLRRYFPELPYYNVNIEHLLSHGSGIPEYVWLADRHWPDSAGQMTNKDVIRMLAEVREPAWSAPGQRHRYCNTNFVLLASIIEKVSGMTYPEFLKKHIFEPLGMRNTRVWLPGEKVASLRVKGHYGNGAVFPDDYQDGTYGDKNIQSTVWDLYRFYRGLRDNKLFPATVREEMFRTRYTRARGFTEYALGWRKRVEDSVGWVFHTGWWHGFRSNFYMDMAHDICVITLSNRLSGGFVPGRVITAMCNPGKLQAIRRPREQKVLNEQSE